MCSLLTNLIGWAAAVIGTCIMIPQVIKSFRMKKTKDVSMIMVLIFILNCVLWSTYGFLLGSYQMLVSNTIVLVLLVMQLIAKFKYDKLG